MTLVITLKPEAENQLEERAAAKGVPVQRLATEMLEERLLSQDQPIKEPTVEEDPELVYQYAMLRAGLISEIKPRNAVPSSYQERPLIQVKGKPLSETIIEERR